MIDTKSITTSNLRLAMSLLPDLVDNCLLGNEEGNTEVDEFGRVVVNPEAQQGTTSIPGLWLTQKVKKTDLENNIVYGMAMTKVYVIAENNTPLKLEIRDTITREGTSETFSVVERSRLPGTDIYEILLGRTT